jgi:hypothetical protein
MWKFLVENVLSKLDGDKMRKPRAYKLKLRAMMNVLRTSFLV